MAIFGTTKKTKGAKKEGGAKHVRSAMAHKLPAGRAHEVILAPWFSEKALIATDKGVYVFAVPKSATRAHVAAAVKEIYNVTPRKVHLLHLPAKKVSMRSRSGHAYRAARHKAYVYLKPGESIQFA